MQAIHKNFACLVRRQDTRSAFLAGKGSGPDAAPVGAHKSFKHNAIIFGLIFGAIGLFIGMLG